MRPTPAEIIASVCRVLEERVEPDLSSDYVRAELRQLLGLLRSQDWDEQLRTVARDNARLRTMLRRGTDLLADTPSPVADLARDDAATPATFEELNNVNLDLRTRLMDMICQLETGDEVRNTATEVFRTLWSH